MKITAKGRYGLRAVVNLASTYSDTPISIRSLAEKENLSPEFLEQIFYKLKKAGYITSSRGAGGGFMLNKPLEEISVLDVLDAVGEDVSLSPCQRETKKCVHMATCSTFSLWQGGTEMMKNYFRNISLRDILNGELP